MSAKKFTFKAPASVPPRPHLSVASVPSVQVSQGWQSLKIWISASTFKHNYVKLWSLLKYQFWKNVTSEKWNSGGLNTFTTYLSSLLGVIAEYNSNHAQKWRQICPKVFNPSEFHFSEVTFLQNWYFRLVGKQIPLEGTRLGLEGSLLLL